VAQNVHELANRERSLHAHAAAGNSWRLMMPPALSAPHRQRRRLRPSCNGCRLRRPRWFAPGVAGSPRARRRVSAVVEVPVRVLQLDLRVW
jgi:hypothetical protein